MFFLSFLLFSRCSLFIRYGAQSSDSFIEPVLRHIAFRMAVAALAGGFVGAFTSLWTTLALLDISLDQFYSVVRCLFSSLASYLLLSRVL